MAAKDPAKTDLERTAARDSDAAIHPTLGVPKGVALVMGAGLVGLFFGGVAVAFTAAVAAPAIRERLRRRREQQAAKLTRDEGTTAA